jgi:hypothetical protein
MVLTVCLCVHVTNVDANQYLMMDPGSPVSGGQDMLLLFVDNTGQVRYYTAAESYNIF